MATQANPFDEYGSSETPRPDDFSSLDHEALPFITVDEHDKFHVNPAAVRYLKSLTGKIAVVAIAGEHDLWGPYADGTQFIRAIPHRIDSISTTVTRRYLSHREVLPPEPAHGEERCLRCWADGEGYDEGDMGLGSRAVGGGLGYDRPLPRLRGARQHCAVGDV